MRVNVAVCGIFHHRKYIGELSRRGVLQAFYYSHLRSTTAASLGITQGHAHNLWPKEYLYRGINRLLKDPGTRALGPLTHDLWQWQLLRNWEPCDLFQVMLHGTAVKALRHARREGAVTLGEPVNAHPEVLQRLMEEEHDRLGLPPYPAMSLPDRRIVEEIPGSDALLVASQWMKRSFVQKGYPADKVIVLPFASDTTRFFPLSDAERKELRDDKFRVICVAQLNARKGQAYLFEAWKQLNYPKSEAELVIVGVPSAGFETVMKRYDGLFTYIPRIEHDKLRREFGRASVMVLPSVEDGFGMVALEAMACGVPVITTDQAGVADVIEEGRSGHVVPARSADALAQKIDALRKDPPLRHAMGERSHHLSRTTLTWPAYVDALVEIYARLLAARTPPQSSR